jgi:asparagine synthase (glutamine-hydrolysing)
MCGISGQFNYLRQEPVDAEAIRRMAAAIRHRGPDDEGFFIDGPLGFGFRRLSIIDLSGGHQPMSDESETVWVIFNGEIYNFQELRAELEAKGHRFRTRSDTEVIVHGYREWGTDVFNRMNGMFGLAIWDVRRRRLVVARDAMGIKPLYYRAENGRLTFGSEVRAVTAGDSGRAEFDPVAMNQFLRFRHTPAPLTVFKGIRKLRPGGMLVVEDGTCREATWYDFSPEPFARPPSDEDAREELLALYRAAVKRHLISDVPLGILLSGGVDSGLLLGLMSEVGRNWNTYTVGYGQSFADDELQDAAETAAIFGSRHAGVQLDQAEFERALPKVVSILEEPITSSSVVPMYFVCERARHDVKVVIVGQGPDELFAGYKRHIGVHYGRIWRSLPSPIRATLAAAVSALDRNETVKRGVRSLAIPNRLERYEHVFSLAPAERIAGLFQDGLLPPGAAAGPVGYWRELLPGMEKLDELGGFQLLEIRSSLPDELLMFVDKISMVHGIEGRVPYLDRTVVEYALRLDASYKIRAARGKWLHRQVWRNFLPPRIRGRKKRGFAVNVVDGWFHSRQQGQLSEILLDSSSLMFQYLIPERVRLLLKEHQSGRQDNHKLLFSLVVFELWLRGAANGANAVPRPAAVRTP